MTPTNCVKCGLPLQAVYMVDGEGIKHPGCTSMPPGQISQKNMNYFNQLSPAEAERLSLLLEECGEVIQIIGKIQRHGYESTHPDGGPTNRQLLAMELGHVNAAGDLLVAWHGGKDTSDLNVHDVHKSFMKKRDAYAQGKYLHHNP